VVQVVFPGYTADSKYVLKHSTTPNVIALLTWVAQRIPSLTAHNTFSSAIIRNESPRASTSRTAGSAAFALPPVPPRRKHHQAATAVSTGARQWSHLTDGSSITAAGALEKAAFPAFPAFPTASPRRRHPFPARHSPLESELMERRVTLREQVRAHTQQPATRYMLCVLVWTDGLSKRMQHTNAGTFGSVGRRLRGCSYSACACM
jgi:hypothetical protein